MGFARAAGYKAAFYTRNLQGFRRRIVNCFTNRLSFTRIDWVPGLGF